MTRWRLVLIKPDGTEVPSRITYLIRRAAQTSGKRATGDKRGWRYRTEPEPSGPNENPLTHHQPV